MGRSWTKWKKLNAPMSTLTLYTWVEELYHWRWILRLMFDLGFGWSHFHFQKTHTELYKSLYQVESLIWEEKDEKSFSKFLLKKFVRPLVVNNNIIFRQEQKPKKPILYHKLKFVIPLLLKPDGVNLWYFKIKLFNLLEFTVWSL